MTMNKAPMTTTDELLKPAVASLASRVPVTSSTAMAPRNAASAGTLVNSSTANIVRTVTIVIHAYRLRPKNIISLIVFEFYVYVYEL